MQLAGWWDCAAEEAASTSASTSSARHTHRCTFTYKHAHHVQQQQRQRVEHHHVAIDAQVRAAVVDECWADEEGVAAPLAVAQQPSDDEVNAMFDKLAAELAVPHDAIAKMTPTMKWSFIVSQSRSQSRSKEQRSQGNLSASSLTRMLLSTAFPHIPVSCTVSLLESLVLCLRTQPLPWVKDFVERDGLNIVLRILRDTLLDFTSQSEDLVKLQGLCVRAVKAVANNPHGVGALLRAPGAVVTLSLCLASPHIRAAPQLLCDVLSLLVAVCLHERPAQAIGLTGHQLLLSAMTTVSQWTHGEERRFKCVVQALERTESLEVQGKCVALVNQIIGEADSLNLRISIRNEFAALGFTATLQQLEQQHKNGASTTVAQQLLTQIDIYNELRELDDEDSRSQLNAILGGTDVDLTRADKIVFALEAQSAKLGVTGVMLSLLQLVLAASHAETTKDSVMKVLACEQLVRQLVLQGQPRDAPDARKQSGCPVFFVQGVSVSAAEAEQVVAGLSERLAIVSEKLQAELGKGEEREKQLDEYAATIERLNEQLAGGPLIHTTNLTTMSTPQRGSPIGNSVITPLLRARLGGTPLRESPFRRSTPHRSTPVRCSPLAAPPPPPPPPPKEIQKPELPSALQQLPKPSAAMKCVQWTQIPLAVFSKTIFATLRDFEEFHVPFEHLQENFAAKPNNAGAAQEPDDGNTQPGGVESAPANYNGMPGSVARLSLQSRVLLKTEPMPKKQQTAQVLDPMLARNIGILLRGLRRTSMAQVLCGIRDGDETLFTTDPTLVQAFSKFLPSNSDVENIRTYERKPGALPLGLPEQYAKEVSAIVMVESKLKALQFKLEFPARADSLNHVLTLIKTACHVVTHSRRFQQLLCLIMLVGNFLNSGTSRGQCASFKITLLSKLHETKALDGQHNLLHFIASVITSDHPDLLQLPSEFAPVVGASRVPGKTVVSELAEMRQGMQALEFTLDQLTAVDPEDHFITHMADFMDKAYVTLDTLREMHTNTAKHFAKLLVLLGEDSEKPSPPEDLFTEFRIFIENLTVRRDSYFVVPLLRDKYFCQD
eukprot:TRINITY_DN1823_c0_g1_i3.p1 TRINITY_DN1823_c0_g1~~TRINITY_DN1823_c0_g1_i3.p1  ORF type:complete len:1060 (-),score=236.28 TRINITY_DN1823_c0_g1_i3:62-3241(-)